MSEDIIKIAKESLENLLNLIQEKYENIDVDLIDNVLNIETSDDQVLMMYKNFQKLFWMKSKLSRNEFRKNQKLLKGGQ